LPLRQGCGAGFAQEKKTAMMFNLPYVITLATALAFVFGCQSRADRNQSQTGDQYMAVGATPQTAADSLVAVLNMDSIVTLADGLPLRFTVVNPTRDTLRFTEYHTPFEGFMNNFLTITHRDGHDVPYIGVMTRRVMPPVEASFHAVAPGDSVSVEIDLVRGYRFEKPGSYTITYTGGSVSGIAGKETISVIVEQ